MTAQIPSGAETDGRVLVTFVCDGLSDGALTVMRLSVREGVSRLHTIDVSLEGFTEPIDGGSLLGRGARIVCTRPDGSPLRSFLGIVTEADAEVTVVAKRFRIHLVLRSPLFALELSTDRAVFTEVSATDVIKTLFGRVGILSSSIVLRCDPPARVRRSITLVGDSLLASVERLLEEEGLVCFCVHAADGPRFVIGAGSAVWETAAAPSFVYNPRGASLFAFDGVVAESSLAASSVRLLDHDPEKPVLSLTAEAQMTEVPDAVVEEWPGGHGTPGAGSRVAKARLAGLRGGTKTIKATGSAPHLAAGHAFSVEGTPHDLDGDYIALEVRHSFERDGAFRTQVRAIARTASFAPRRRAPRARTAGPTTAWVAGPSGAIVHTDDHGRTKLRYPWDRGAKDDGTSSAFARVLSPMMLSSQVVPRVGWGVLVDFENGDPDRPVVVGRLFDGHHPPPHPLPAARTTSTWLTPRHRQGPRFPRDPLRRRQGRRAPPPARREGLRPRRGQRPHGDGGRGRELAGRRVADGHHRGERDPHPGDEPAAHHRRRVVPHGGEGLGDDRQG